MCNAIACELILDVLKKAIISGEVFTAYDLTIAVRATTDDNVRHFVAGGIDGSCISGSSGADDGDIVGRIVRFFLHDITLISTAVKETIF